MVLDGETRLFRRPSCRVIVVWSTSFPARDRGRSEFVRVEVVFVFDVVHAWELCDAHCFTYPSFFLLSVHII